MQAHAADASGEASEAQRTEAAAADEWITTKNLGFR
jgi:hypothetical protein